MRELYRHPSFDDLFSSSHPSLFGGESKESLITEIRQFYTEDDEEKYGVVGIRFERIARM